MLVTLSVFVPLLKSHTHFLFLSLAASSCPARRHCSAETAKATTTIWGPRCYKRSKAASRVGCVSHMIWFYTTYEARLTPELLNVTSCRNLLITPIRKPLIVNMCCGYETSAETSSPRHHSDRNGCVLSFLLFTSSLFENMLINDMRTSLHWWLVYFLCNNKIFESSELQSLHIRQHRRAKHTRDEHE